MMIMAPARRFAFQSLLHYRCKKADADARLECFSSEGKKEREKNAFVVS